MADEENGNARPTTFSMFKEIQGDLRALRDSLGAQTTQIAVMSQRLTAVENRPLALSMEDRRELQHTSRESERRIVQLERDSKQAQEDIGFLQEAPKLFDAKQLRTLYAQLDSEEDAHAIKLQKRANRIAYIIGIVGLLSWPVNAFIDIVVKPHIS